MFKTFFYISLLLISSLCRAQSPALYQVDVLVFMHQTSSQHKVIPYIAFSASHTQAITLKPAGSEITPYYLLPTSKSELDHEYQKLYNSNQYQVLGSFSWLQPTHNKKPIFLSIHEQNWNVEGTLEVRKGNYYLLDTKLVFSSLNPSEDTFLFAQKQRLKHENIYYLDHPKAGMLIKIHQMA